MNAIGPVDESQRKATKVAGFSFLFATAVVIAANFGITFRLIIPGNAVDTARNIMAHETLFRLNVACNLLYVVIVVVLLSALYVVLGPVQRSLALTATLFRLIFAVIWGLTALHSLSALRLLGNAVYLPVFPVDQLQTLARLHLALSNDVYYVGLPFWGLASTVCSYLWFKSRYIPRVLAIFGLVSSAWCVFCAFAFLIFPHFDAAVNASWFDVPLVLFEITLAVWLLLKGLSASVPSRA